MKKEKLKNRIRSLLKRTPSEVKISEYFFHNYPRLMFETISTISKNTEVSKATVVRFISKLGFNKFSDFHMYIRDEIFPDKSSPPNRLFVQKKQLEESKEDILAQNFNCIIENLHHVHDSINQEKFTAAVNLIMSSGGRLYITGLRSSYALAYQFYLLMIRVRAETFLIGPEFSMSPDVLLDVKPEDTLITVFRYPYARQTLKTARLFAEKKASIVLITDREFSPMSDITSVQLVVSSKGLSVFNSSSAFMALLDSLQIAALQMSGQDVLDRLKRSEKLSTQMETYCADKQTSADLVDKFIQSS